MRVAAAAFLVLATAALAAGCGQTGVTKSGDISHGKQLFVAKCGGCHRLQDAGTQGQTGPDLDGAFAGPRRQHFKLSTIRQVVYDQIYHAAAPMPQRLVTGADASDVASYVASVAGAGRANEGAAPTIASTTKASGGGGAAAQGAMLFESRSLERLMRQVQAQQYTAGLLIDRRFANAVGRRLSDIRNAQRRGHLPAAWVHRRPNGRIDFYYKHSDVARLMS